MPTEYYRYISNQNEVDQVEDFRIVESVSSGPDTWFTPTKYKKQGQAKQELAMPQEPQHRVGPINDVKMPSFAAGPRRVQPNFNQPGGGVEVSVHDEIDLFGLWDFNNGEWDL